MKTALRATFCSSRLYTPPLHLPAHDAFSQDTAAEDGGWSEEEPAYGFCSSGPCARPKPANGLALHWQASVMACNAHKGRPPAARLQNLPNVLRPFSTGYCLASSTRETAPGLSYLSKNSLAFAARPDIRRIHLASPWIVIVGEARCGVGQDIDTDRTRQGS